MRSALLSVSDKTGLLDLGRSLHRLGWRILATGGTEKALKDAGIPVTSVEDITKFPECFDGRVKTMHPMITGGILYRRDSEKHVEEAKKYGIEPIDLVVVNLYPFAQTVRDSTKTREEIIEQIDIGGPTMLRSAAKNHQSVTAICDPTDYSQLIDELEKNGDTTLEFRQQLAAKVFLHTAAYDSLITEFLSGGTNAGVILTAGRTLRYGENPHQTGKYFEVYGADHESHFVQTPHGASLPGTAWHQHQGKEMSYLNILDADAAWAAVCDFSEPTVVMVKHANPSGIASSKNLEDAFQRAYDADRLSAFGVVIALNRPCTAAIAQKILDQKIFVELIIAPDFEEGFLELMKQKPNVRVLAISDKRGAGSNSALIAPRSPLYRSALNGLLVQDEDHKEITAADLTFVTTKRPSGAQIADLLFAWKAVKFAKSNAIVLAKDAVTVGIGAGQTSRVDSTWIAAKRAGDKAIGAVMASDAFFPFPDSVEEAARCGIVAIIQPGGSVRDAEVFTKAEELGIAMVTTGVRAFRH